MNGENDVLSHWVALAERDIATARSLAADRLAWLGLGDGAVEDGRTVVSELVTNALRHGADPVTVRVWASPPGFAVVEVEDVGARLPVFPASQPSVEDGQPPQAGLGLHLATSLVQGCCGVISRDPHTGKSVWFALAFEGQMLAPRAVSARVRLRVQGRNVERQPAPWTLRRPGA